MDIVVVADTLASGENYGIIFLEKTSLTSLNDEHGVYLNNFCNICGLIMDLLTCKTIATYCSTYRDPK